MRTGIAILVLSSLLVLPFVPQTAGAYGGNDGPSSSNGGMSSDMSTGVVGTFFGVPISVVPFQTNTNSPQRDDIPTLSAMSQESIEERMEADLQAALERSEAAGFTLSVWEGINSAAWVIEWAGAGSRFALGFIPGVGLVTNVGLSTLNGAVGAYQQGESVGGIVEGALQSGATSGLVNGFDAGGNLANSQFSQSAINAAIEAFVSAMLANRNSRAAMPSQPYDRPTAPEGWMGMQYQQ